MQFEMYVQVGSTIHTGGQPAGCIGCNVFLPGQHRWAAGVLATKHLSLQTEVAPKVTIRSSPFNSNFNLLSFCSLIQLPCSLPFRIHLTS